MTNKNETDLKSCPFCGGNRVAQHTREYESHFRHCIECLRCQCEISSSQQSKQDAIYSAQDKWNTRAAQPQPPVIEGDGFLTIKEEVPCSICNHFKMDCVGNGPIDQRYKRK